MNLDGVGCGVDEVLSSSDGGGSTGATTTRGTCCGSARCGDFYDARLNKIGRGLFRRRGPLEKEVLRQPDGVQISGHATKCLVVAKSR